jgi:hypothetical protein
MNLVTFLADLYYSHSNYNNHLAKPAMILVVVCSYILLTLLALITFGKFNLTVAANAFKAFAYLAEFLIGILYLVLGSMLIYYGMKIATIFGATPTGASRYEQIQDNSNYETNMKLKILSNVIGGLFLFKSFLALLSAFHFFHDFYPTSIGANLWDFLVSYL